MKIEHLYLSPGHNFFGRHGQGALDHPMIEVPEVACLAGRGLQGDRFLDYKPDYKGQITFFAMETHEWLEATLGLTGTAPSAYRRNVLTRGADLNAWIGREFSLQGVCFLGTEESKPCYWMNAAVGSGAEELLKGRGGLRAKILSNGWLRRD